MCSQLKPFSLMGMPNNSEILLSDNDLEFNFLVRPTLQFEEEDEQEHCEVAPSEDSDGTEDPKEEQEQERQEIEQQKEGEKCKLMVSCLKIKLPSLEEFKNAQEQQLDLEDGLKTPTSLEKRIPLVLSCPPAPRKPKALPSNKRKLMGGRRRVLLDLSNEIESLFPPSMRVDLGAKIKKVRPQI
ncbi:Cyclin-dependent protein kinase inhibitor SMR3 [Euphorbia peplus]|nr:Cyclin-dependent protein kinase inhibitor SMR3 [Euphorbia peplus]